MKVSSRSSNSLKDFKLVFKPRTIIFLKKNTINLKIYLEKDVQVIGAVKEIIPPMSPNITYTFSEFNQPIQFRIVNQKISNYILSLYRVQSSGGEQIIEHSSLKFNKFIEEYFQEFITIEHQLNAELKQKQKEGNALPKKWKDLAYKFTKKVFTSGIKFKKTDAILQFTIEPFHHYDQLVKQLDLIDHYKSQKGQNKAEVYKKSKAIPDYLPMDKQNAYFKQEITDSQLTLVSPYNFQFKAKHQNKPKEPSQKTINADNKINNEDNTIETQESIKSLLNTTNQNFHHRNKQLRVQQVVEQDQFQQNLLTERPDIHIQKTPLIPQIKHSTKRSILQIESFIKPKSSLSQKGGNKQNIITIFFLLASLFVIFLLMHPLSKV